jgi:CRP-like cAMP-binding protein
MPGLDRSLIANLPAFEGLTSEQLVYVLREARSTRFPKGSDLFQQDGEARSFFLLLHGFLRVSRLTPDGQQVVVCLISCSQR